MAYDKQTWRNYSDGNTPITAERLNHMEDGILDSSNYIETIRDALHGEVGDGVRVTGRVTTNGVRLNPRTGVPPGNNRQGDVAFIDGKFMVCVTSGTPGIWESPSTSSGSENVYQVRNLSGNSTFNESLSAVPDEIEVVVFNPPGALAHPSNLTVNITDLPEDRRPLTVVLPCDGDRKQTLKTSKTSITSTGAHGDIVLDIMWVNGDPTIQVGTGASSVPYIPAVQGDWDGTPPTNVGDALDSLAAGLTAVPGNFATVAETGSFDDLNDVPNFVVGDEQVNKIVSLTREDYDSILNLDPNTLYLVSE